MTTTERRHGLSVRLRITFVIAVLVAIALSIAGLLVYAISLQRLDQQAAEDVNQEIAEFGSLRREGVDPSTGEPFAAVRPLLRLFLERQVPARDELLAGWGDDRFFFATRTTDPLLTEPGFEEAVRRLLPTGGSTTLDSPSRGDVVVTVQPVRAGQTRGALVIAKYHDLERRDLVATMRTYAVVAALAMVAVTALAAWQSGRLLAPLRTLRRTTQEISETDLSRRLPEVGNDDITALTRTVNDMLARLEEAFEGQRRFLDDAGHELKTPLTVLAGHLELLDPDDPDDVARTRDLLVEEVHRMSRLVGDLILLAKSRRPDFVTVAPVDLDEIVRGVLARAEVMAERDWRLEEVAAGQALLDTHRITQALLQLCDNAVKHTAPGDRIALGSAIEGSRVHLWVRDTGDGIPAADRERVRGRFGRSTVNPGDEGFGLGLSIVSAIAEGHHGRLLIEDGDPRADPPGTLVLLDLPADAASTDGPTTPVTTVTPAAPDMYSPKMPNTPKTLAGSTPEEET